MARDWGGPDDPDYVGRCSSVATDLSGNVYAAGWFSGDIDFDPGPGVDSHSSKGNVAAFLSKFPPDGNW